MAEESLHVPQAGYKKLAGGNYYIPKFGYLSIAGATAVVPGVANLSLFGRGFARSQNRGERS